ncbi:hypothetical protein SK128_013611 [Halocaridina rubra]|uniref:Uncharacterized protein n=1 Tax=Halocaridina rubra TaxID=373956 RepID=A0AAN9A0S5_HALRR
MTYVTQGLTPEIDRPFHLRHSEVAIRVTSWHSIRHHLLYQWPIRCLGQEEEDAGERTSIGKRFADSQWDP